MSGRCELCDTAESEFQIQYKVKVFCGGGIGVTTMWKCQPCINKTKIVVIRKKEDGSKPWYHPATPGSDHTLGGTYLILGFAKNEEEAELLIQGLKVS